LKIYYGDNIRRYEYWAIITNSVLLTTLDNYSDHPAGFEVSSLGMHWHSVRDHRTILVCRWVGEVGDICRVDGGVGVGLGLGGHGGPYGRGVGEAVVAAVVVIHFWRMGIGNSRYSQVEIILDVS
jgi:hypothetical protein